MSKKNLPKVIKSVQSAMKKRSPEILTGIGIAGMITATVLAVRATPKALTLIDEEKSLRNQERLEEVEKNEELEFERVEKLEPLDLIKTTWKCYIPAAAIGTISAFCLIGASSVNFRRNAALATAYTLSEAALKDYQEKVIEEFGEKKERVVRDAIAKDRIEKDPVVNKEVILTERGNTLCYDVISGRYFKTDIDCLKKAENELNRQMRNDMYITLNEFYYEIGLDGIKIGDDLGWDIDHGYINLDFSSQLAKDGTPCLVVDHQIPPRYDFR